MSALISNTAFEHVTKAYITDAHFVDTREINMHPSMVMVEDLAMDEEGSATHEASESINWGYILTESSLVGILLVVGMGAVVVYAVTMKVVYPAVANTLGNIGNKLDALAAATYGKTKKKKNRKSKKAGVNGEGLVSDSDSDIEATGVSMSAPARKKKIAIIGGEKSDAISLDDMKKLIATVRVTNEMVSANF